MGMFAISTAPWWAVPLVAGIFGVGGVGITQFGSFHNERRKHEREDRLRWLGDVRLHASEYLTTVDTYWRKAIEVYYEGADVFNIMHTESTELLAALDRLTFIAPPEIVLEAVELRYSTLEFENNLDFPRHLDPLQPVGDPAPKDFHVARLDFLNSIRTHLQIAPLPADLNI